MYRIIEGDKQTLTIRAGGDFTGRDNYFTAKASLLSKRRLIDVLIPEDKVTYNNGYTMFNIELEPADTLNIKVPLLIADIESRSRTDSSDVITAWQRRVEVKVTVRRDGDLLPENTTSTTLVDASKYNEGDLLRVENGMFVGKNEDEMKSILGVQSLITRVSSLEADVGANNNELTNRIDELTDRVEYLELTKASTEEIILITT